MVVLAVVVVVVEDEHYHLCVIILLLQLNCSNIKLLYCFIAWLVKNLVLQPCYPNVKGPGFWFLKKQDPFILSIMNGTRTDLELNLGLHLSHITAPVRDYDLIGAVNSYSFRVNVYCSLLYAPTRCCELLPILCNCKYCHDCDSL